MKKIILSLFLIVFLPVTAFGAYYQIEQIVSVDSDGITGNNASEYPSISADGRYVVFHSSATNLVSNDTNGLHDVFLHDIETEETIRVSESFLGGDSDGSAYDPVISADGRYIVFESNATNLVPDDINGEPDVFLYDRINQSMNIVSFDSNGIQGNNDSTDPSISADGQYVVFKSSATNLVLDDTNGVNDVFLRDTVLQTTVRLSVDSNDVQGNAASNYPQISHDGRYVVFESSATNLVSDDTNGVSDIFLYDNNDTSLIRVSKNEQGEQGNGASGFNTKVFRISGGGEYIIFESNATNLVSDDTNGIKDLFLYTIDTEAIERISKTATGDQISVGNSTQSTISGNGSYVSFASSATNIIPDDTNGVFDIFIYDVALEKVTRLILSDPSQQANTSMFYPVLSEDADFIVFHSSATNLISDDTNGVRDIFLARQLNPELTYVGSFSETSENDGSVEGSLVITFANSNDTFVNQGGVLTIGTEYEIENLSAGLSSVLSVNNDGTEATLTLEGQAIDHENVHSVQNMTLQFLDDAFTIVDADEVIGASYEEGNIEFSDRRRQSSGGSVQSQVVNLQSMGKDEQADQVKEEFSHLFEESSVDNLLVSLLTQLAVLQNQVSLLQSYPMSQSDHCPTLYQWIQGFSHCIQSLQTQLGNIRIDGIFGPETHETVLSFQEKMNIRTDGIVGPETKKSLGW
ncbi:MAG: peptidoglycan-binding protein [Candidatus Pacebacteria bacterium]|nr:peptidoglycan-binding protein [Candidatus Paceibacterota bacterium]